MNAAKNKIQVLFTIIGTPEWAKRQAKGANRAPAKMDDLRYFALAAAKRYSGTFKREDGTKLPAVRKWLAWNEPNNPVFLKPQWAKRRSRRYDSRSPVAPSLRRHLHGGLVTGVHASHLAKEVVGCGATDPRGNNAARSSRPSISPIAFLQDLRGYGLKRSQLRRLRASPVLRPAERVADAPCRRASRRSRSGTSRC